MLDATFLREIVRNLFISFYMFSSISSSFIEENIYSNFLWRWRSIDQFFFTNNSKKNLGKYIYKKR